MSHDQIDLGWGYVLTADNLMQMRQDLTTIVSDLIEEELNSIILSAIEILRTHVDRNENNREKRIHAEVKNAEVPISPALCLVPLSLALSLRDWLKKQDQSTSPRIDTSALHLIN